MRDAIKAIYGHVGKTVPHWVDDDRDHGWDDGGGSFGVPTIRRENTDESQPDVVKSPTFIETMNTLARSYLLVVIQNRISPLS